MQKWVFSHNITVIHISFPNLRRSDGCVGQRTNRNTNPNGAGIFSMATGRYSKGHMSDLSPPFHILEREREYVRERWGRINNYSKTYRNCSARLATTNAALTLLRLGRTLLVNE